MSHLSIPLPKVKSSEIVYRGFCDLRIDLLQLPEGLTRSYAVLMTGLHAAAVLAETEEGKLVINLEYRHPTGNWLLSCPGGKLDPGESPLEAGARELLEETGYHSQEIQLLGSCYPFPAVSDQKIHFLWAKNAKLVQPASKDEFEFIHTTLKTKEELLHEIAQGHPADGVLCTALLLKSLTR